MIGCLADTVSPSGVARVQATRPEQGRLELEIVVIAVVALDSLDFRAGAEYQGDALVNVARGHLEQRFHARARPPARLLDDEADRIGLVQEAQAPGLRQILAVARIEEYA